MSPEVLIVGGGMAGLTAAWTLAQRDVPVAVVEASSHWGGKLRTLRHEGVTAEFGPDVFLGRNPNLARLCTALGLNTMAVSARSAIVRDGRLHPLPDGLTGLVPSRPLSLWNTPLLSIPQKARAAMEMFVPPRTDQDDESLEAFFCRRFGKGVWQNLVGPLVGGVYGEDAGPISLAATLPHLAEQERRDGRLLKLRPSAPAPPGAGFLSLPGGMDELPRNLVARLGQMPHVSLHASSPVQEIRQDTAGYAVQCERQTFHVPKVLFAVSAATLGRLLRPHFPALSAHTENFPMGGLHVGFIAFPRQAWPHAFTGYLIPKHPNRTVQAVTLYSRKHPQSAPINIDLVRVFVSGSVAPESAEQAAREELRSRGIDGPVLWSRWYTWENALPRYTIGHPGRVQRLRDGLSRYPGLAVAGSAFDGAGLPDVVSSASKAALDVLQ